MIRTSRVIASILVGAAMSPATPLHAQTSRCSGNSAPRWPISVASHSGPHVSLPLRQKIANALAATWGNEEERDSYPRGYFAVLRDLEALAPGDTGYTLGKWKVRQGDSAIVLLTYRRGQVPELDIPQQGLRREFAEWITKSVGMSIARALNGSSFRDTMPLQFADAADLDVTVEVRFGGTPRDGAATARLALQDEMPRYRSGMGPRYPDQYRLDNLEGEVLMGFVIDTNGRVDPTSVRAIAYTAPLFVTSVRNALRTMRFHPAVVDCRPRRTVAIQPFNFTLTRYPRKLP